MTSAVASPTREVRAAGQPTTATRLFEPGRPTLEDRVVGCWDSLVAEGRADCPVCGSTMSVLHGCEGCGSELS